MIPRFNVGNRVRVRVAKDIIKKKHIICDVGYVKKVTLSFIGSKFEKITYEVCLDGNYCSNIPTIGREVQVSEGFNVDTSLCSIDAEKIG